MSLGVVLQGQRWQRPADRAGIACLRNGIFSAHQAFLAAGGIDFFLGDGTLRYAAEQTLEAYHCVALTRQAWLSADVQHIRNPAYKADRGPVTLVAVRMHLEY